MFWLLLLLLLLLPIVVSWLQFAIIRDNVSNRRSSSIILSGILNGRLILQFLQLMNFHVISLKSTGKLAGASKLNLRNSRKWIGAQRTGHYQ